VSDGPYVFYDGAMRISKYIEPGRVRTELDSHTVAVELAGPAKGFSVKFRNHLTVEPAVFAEPVKIFAVGRI